MTDAENFKVLIIVGRDKTEQSFFERIAPYLYDVFVIRGIYALGEPFEGDGSERFICFVAGNEAGLWTAEAQAVRINRSADKEAGIPVSVRIFEDMDEALEFANGEYNFEISEQIQSFRDRAKEVFEKFGYSTASETEKFMVLSALMNSGMIALTRGLLDDVQVPVIVHVAHGSDTTSIKPLAILMTDEILENLEMPIEMRSSNNEE